MERARGERSVRDNVLFNFNVTMPLPSASACTEHILDKYTVPRGGIVYENVRHRAHELAVLDDGRA